MYSDRTAASVAGALYITGTVAGVLSLVATGGLLDAPDFLNLVAANANRVLLGSLLVLVMGIALAMVPAVLYPILRRSHESLAVGYVVFRGALETLTYIVTALCWLVLVVVARQFVDAGPAVAAQVSTLGVLLVKAQAPIVAIQDIVFSLGGLMLYYVLYQTRLLPRWLAGWGLVGAALYLTAGLIAIFSSHLVILLMPLALQEMVMAVWLIVRGFSQSAFAPRVATAELAGQPGH